MITNFLNEVDWQIIHILNHQISKQIRTRKKCKRKYNTMLCQCYILIDILLYPEVMNFALEKLVKMVWKKNEKIDNSNYFKDNFEKSNNM